MNGIDADRGWASAICRESLNHFLQHEDQVAAIKKYLHERLDELQAFKQQNPKLPWSPSAGKDIDESD
jgi:hypothetical protein